MPHRIALLTLALLSLVGSSASAAITLQAHDFNVFVDLQDILLNGPPIIPGNPVHDLSDPTQPEFTTDVNHLARFDFGILGHNGETFSFLNLGGTLSEDQHLIYHLQAEGSEGSFFDVFFDVSFQDEAGANAPFSAQLAQGPPIFPSGSISINFQLYEHEQSSADAPFTVGISIRNADEPATFALAPAAAVPEPGTCSIMLGGLLSAACYSRRRRQKRPRVALR